MLVSLIIKMNKLHTFKVGFIAFSIGLFVGAITYKFLMAWSGTSPWDFKTDIAESAIIAIVTGLVLATLNVFLGVIPFAKKGT